jgi:hypothetical protein
MSDTHLPPFWREHLIAVVGGHADGQLRYPKILAHLQAFAGACTAEHIVEQCADELHEWGSDPDLISRVLETS